MQHAAYRKAPAVMPNAALSGSIASSLLRAPATLIARLAAWQRQAEERAHLAQLSDYQLQDMGLSRGAVEEMARKPFWNRCAFRIPRADATAGRPSGRPASRRPRPGSSCTVLRFAHPSAAPVFLSSW